ncbi:MAG: choice-of-anchor U domain-containing protein [bacterium]
MKRLIYIFFLIACFTIPILKNVQAEITIWRIGKLDDDFDDFKKSALIDCNAIDYTVSADWALLLGQSDPNWGEFPRFLYPYDDHNHIPQEIIINFDYLQDYTNPILNIRATKTSTDPNTPHAIDLCKGDPRDDFQIGRRSIKDSPYFWSYDFPLGYITKGLNEKNRIVIRCRGPAGIPVVFDSLYLHMDDTDTDGDGVSDADEGACSLDPNTVCIPIKSYNPADVKRIYLHVDIPDGALPTFQGVRFLDPNDLGLPAGDLYFPYEPLGFSIEDIGTGERIDIYIGFEDPLYSSARFYAYQDTNTWVEMGFAFLDANTAIISLHDGGLGDSDGATDGVIHAAITLSYPDTLHTQIEKGECFINTLHRRKYNGIKH